MRIAFVYDVPYPWHKGGIEQIFSTEAEALAKDNEVHFFTLRWPGMEKEFVHAGVRYHAFGKAREENVYRHGRRSIREALIYSVFILNLFKYRFDVVITEMFPVLHLPMIRAYCRATGCRLIIRVAELWGNEYWKDYVGNRIGPIAYSYSSAAIRSGSAFYITLSSASRNKLAEFGIEKKRIRVFSPVIDNEAVERIRGEEISKERQVIFSGRFIKEKGLERWIDAVSSAIRIDPRIRGVIVGSGIEERRIRKEIEGRGMEKKIEIRPFYKDKLELYREIARSDAMLHMSEREGLGIIALESIALGTAVIIPDYSPVPEEVKEMCIVESEERIPERIAEMAMKGGSARLRKNNLGLFSISKIDEFYMALFSHMGIEQG